MTKAVVRAGAAVLAAVLLSGCARGPAPAPSALARVRFAGSGTCYPLVRLLTDSYATKHQDVVFQFLPSTHSVGALKAVSATEPLADIGMVSRPLKPEEKKLGVALKWLSDDGLVVAVNPSVGIKNLTRPQIQGIYSGRIDDWSQVGGGKGHIVVLDRNEDESAKIILRDYILGKKLKVTPKAILLYYEPDMINALEKTPNAIGYFSLGDAISKQRKVRLLTVDGVEPTVQNIRDGRYSVVRPLGIVFRPSPDPVVQRIVDYLTSQEATTLMAEEGYAPASRR